MATFDPNTTPISANLTEQFISSRNLKPQWKSIIFARYGTQFNGINQTLQLLGMKEPVASYTWYASEDNRMKRPVTVYAVDTLTPGIGGTVWVTLPNAEHEFTGTKSWPRITEHIMTKDGYKGRITDKDTTNAYGHKIKIEPTNSGTNFGNLTGQTLIIFTGAKAAGTGQIASTTIGTTKRQFYLQIIDESKGLEGSQFIYEPWAPIYQNGNYRLWYLTGTKHMEYLYDGKVDGAFTWGEENTNSLVQTTPDGESNPIYLTKGMIPWITELGKTDTNTMGTWDTSKWNEYKIYMRQQGLTSGFVLQFVGSRVAYAAREAIKAKGQGNGIDKYVENVLNENGALAFGNNFTTYREGDTVFVLSEVPVWDDPMSYAATGHNTQYLSICIPVTSRPSSKDPKVKISNLVYKYGEYAGYNRELETWTLGAAGGNAFRPYTTEYDSTKLYMRGHVGLEFLGANQAIITNPV
jgi:hypothetical protein